MPQEESTIRYAVSAPCNTKEADRRRGMEVYEIVGHKVVDGRVMLVLSHIGWTRSYEGFAAYLDAHEALDMHREPA